MSDKLIKELKALNPAVHEHADLIYDREYHLWRQGEYLGVAIWTRDENVGDSFQKGIWDEKYQLVIQQVYLADRWKLV
ncbi:MAG: hypothetical protein JWR61_1085 [Ferruginibacter sp.]|uniref:hypothetical protein n=1 Tax=Ferruginibacter sp. TaxID=1940288 RepID=UPI002659824B|nr:hypothetical protein [Ferruginibacter sp.]MDB5276130.1 hypothetical protein [Ferruginibacter sp.]